MTEPIKAPAAGKNTPQRPDWAETPPIVNIYTYELALYQDSVCEQDIDLSRDEYIALKGHLAEMRGLSLRADEEVKKTEKALDRDHVVKFLRESIHDCHLDTALMALEAIERNRGCSTPAEDFLSKLIRQLPSGLTPEDVDDDLTTFREEFADVAANCEYAHRFYPDLAAEAAEKAGR